MEAAGVEPCGTTNRINGFVDAHTRISSLDFPPADLLEVVWAWGSLPETLRKALVAIVRTGGAS